VGNSPDQEASESDVDHGFGTVDAFLVVTHETPPPRHPSERSLNDPSTRDDLEAHGGVGSLDDLDGEIPEGGLVHELGAVIGSVGEQMLQPRPALAHTVQDHLSPGAVGNVGGRQVDHQKTAIGVDRDVALATHDLLAGVVSPCFRFRSFDRLAVDDAPGWARLASDALSVEHQRDVVDRLKHEPTHESSKPPIDRLPGREVIRQHPPSPARTRHVADRVQHLPQIDLDRAPRLRRARKKRLNPHPFLVGQVARIPLGLLLDPGHSAARRWGPHPKLESRPKNAFNQFSNGL
jgi:hypothetical protein